MRPSCDQHTGTAEELKFIRQLAKRPDKAKVLRDYLNTIKIRTLDPGVDRNRCIETAVDLLWSD